MLLVRLELSTVNILVFLLLVTIRVNVPVHHCGARCDTYPEPGVSSRLTPSVVLMTRLGGGKPSLAWQLTSTCCPAT